MAGIYERRRGKWTPCGRGDCGGAPALVNSGNRGHEGHRENSTTEKQSNGGRTEEDGTFDGHRYATRAAVGPPRRPGPSNFSSVTPFLCGELRSLHRSPSRYLGRLPPLVSVACPRAGGSRAPRRRLVTPLRVLARLPAPAAARWRRAA